MRRSAHLPAGEHRPGAEVAADDVADAGRLVGVDHLEHRPRRVHACRPGTSAGWPARRSGRAGSPGAAASGTYHGDVSGDRRALVGAPRARRTPPRCSRTSRSATSGSSRPRTRMQPWWRMAPPTTSGVASARGSSISPVSPGNGSSNCRRPRARRRVAVEHGERVAAQLGQADVDQRVALVVRRALQQVDRGEQVAVRAPAARPRPGRARCRLVDQRSTSMLTPRPSRRVRAEELLHRRGRPRSWSTWRPSCL